MTRSVSIFGKVFILKQNPWHSGKLKRLAEQGLVKVKKDLVLATPPPWFGDPSKLSEAQIYQALRFSSVSRRYRGRPLEERITMIRNEAGGPTGRAKPKALRPVKIGRILTIAESRGIPIPDELRGIARETPIATVQVRTRIPRISD
jgi:hypothetical protein